MSVQGRPDAAHLLGARVYEAVSDGAVETDGHQRARAAAGATRDAFRMDRGLGCSAEIAAAFSGVQAVNLFCVSGSVLHLTARAAVVAGAVLAELAADSGEIVSAAVEVAMAQSGDYVDTAGAVTARLREVIPSFVDCWRVEHDALPAVDTALDIVDRMVAVPEHIAT